MPVYELEGVVPVVDPSAYVHPTAVLIGDVHIAAGCFVGPFASLRGDFGRLVMREGSNVQDHCAFHSFPGVEAVVERDGHIGHGAILHGCRIGEGALVGMNAVVMDGAVVGERAFVGAHSFVKAGFEVPAQWLAVGNPAKVTRELTAAELSWKANGTLTYQHLARRYLATHRLAEPLREAEPDRPRLTVDSGTAVPLDQHRRKQ